MSSPVQKAIKFAMRAVNEEATRTKDCIEYSLTEKRGIWKELAKIHNRLGKRYHGEWEEMPLELPNT